MGEQLFHAWISFHIDENTEILDPYVTCIKQVATLLGYGEPQICEVLKSTLLTKLYWVLFPIDDLRQVVETAKRILIKEKIDRQLAGQSSSTQFIYIKDSYNKKVTFYTQDELEDKIDRLTVMMGKLATTDNGSNRQFKPQIYQSKRREQNGDLYDRHNYDQWGYQNRYRSNSRHRKTKVWKNDRGGNFGGNVRMYQHFGR